MRHTLVVTISAMLLQVVPTTAAAQALITPVLHRRIAGTGDGERFGTSVDARDLNGDGILDIAVGAPGATGGGAARVYSARDGGLLVSLPSSTVGAGFGIEVKLVGDTDADGIGDVLVAELAERRAHLFSGADGSPRLAGVQLPYQAGLDAGMSMAGVGDVDGDGSADLAIAWQGDNSRASSAAVFAGATGEPIVVLAGESPFNGSLTVSGDATHDGVPEITAGHLGYTATYSGASGLPLFRVETYDVLGSADVDGDGVRDVLVGMPATPHDAVIAAYSGIDGTFLYRVVVASRPECETAGSCYYRIAIAGLGDVDRDGREDFAASLATAASQGLAEAGTVAVFSGGSGERLAEIHGSHAGAQIGWSVAGTGDVDGDGVPDLVLGAPGARAGSSGAVTGAVLVYRLVRGPAPIAIDVQPERCPNQMPSRGGRPIDVTLLGSAGIDVNDLDPSSIRLAGIAPARERRSAEDVGSPAATADPCACPSADLDGFVDRVFSFEAKALRDLLDGAPGTMQEVELTARLKDGRRVSGRDCVRVAPPTLAEATAAPTQADSPGRCEAHPNPVRSGQTVWLRFTPGDVARSVVTVFDAGARRICRLSPGGRDGAGQILAWDTRDDQGVPVPAGWYWVREARTGATARVLVLR